MGTFESARTSSAPSPLTPTTWFVWFQRTQRATPDCATDQRGRSCTGMFGDGSHTATVEPTAVASIFVFCASSFSAREVSAAPRDVSVVSDAVEYPAAHIL